MKKTLMLISMALLFAACVDKDEVMKDSQKININHAITTKEYTIPVKPGMMSIVVGEDNQLIAVDSVATQILVPTEGTLKVYYAAPSAVTDVLNSLGIDATNGSEVNRFAQAGTYSLWQTIAFEDLLVGDYDYNDLVIHCRYQTQNNTNGNNGKELRIGIQPIALGSTLKLRLGCDIYKGNTPIKTGIIVADNCRQDLFKGQVGYLNTQTHNFNAEFMSKVLSFTFTPTQMAYSGAISVNWYIEVYDKTGTTITNTFHAISAHYLDNHMLDANSNPYGLVMTHTGKIDTQYGQPNHSSGHDWFNYPLEKTKIYVAYPLWESWLRGTSTDFVSLYDGGWNSDNVFHAGQLGVYSLKAGCNNLFDNTWINNEDNGVSFITIPNSTPITKSVRR